MGEFVAWFVGLGFVFVIFACGLSFLICAGLLWIICFCFGWIFSWKLALGIWIILLVLSSLFKKPEGK